jgi:hypothetical protein
LIIVDDGTVTPGDCADKPPVGLSMTRWHARQRIWIVAQCPCGRVVEDNDQPEIALRNGRDDRVPRLPMVRARLRFYGAPRQALPNPTKPEVDHII